MKRSSFHGVFVLTTMRYCLFFILFFISATNIVAQNLVPNPSFEDYNPCGDPNIACKSITSNGVNCKSSCCEASLPQYDYMINSATDNWWGVNIFIPPFYFNECIIKTANFGNSNKHWYKPRTGKAYIMINTFGRWSLNSTYPYNEYRNYAQVRLIGPLQAGCIYEVSSYVLLTPNYDVNFNLGNSSIQASADGLGFYLSTDSIYMNDYNLEFKTLTDIIPQVSNPSGHFLSDSVHYQKVSGIFKAEGGEQWLIIGNFKDNNSTQVDGDRNVSNSAYSIDDVSVQIWRPDLIATKDTTICTSASLTLQLPAGLENYSWSTGETTKQITINSAGTYSVRASNGCETLYDSIVVHLQAPYTTPLNIGVDTFFCQVPQPYRIHAPTGYYAYAWSDHSSANYLDITAVGTYWLDATYACGTLRDTLVVTEFSQPAHLMYPSDDTALCSNQILDIQVVNLSDYKSFVWSNGSTDHHIFVNQAANYLLTATTIKDCIVKDSITVNMIYPPIIRNFSDTIACEETALYFKITPGLNETIQWFDGKTDQTHGFYTSGTYWVKLINSCYTSTDSVAIDFLDCSLNIPNLVTTNNDGKNDFFIIETKIDRPLSLSIYNSWGTEVFRDENYKGQWGGSDLKDGIYFYYITDPLLNHNYKGWVQSIK